MKRVLIVNNIPAPYFDPLFARLGNEPGWALKVCYTSTWNENAGWVEGSVEETSYQKLILDRRLPKLTRILNSPVSAAVALLGELMRERPNYVISYGYTLLPQFVSIMWAILTATPIAIIGDANVHTDKAAGLRRVVKRFWLRKVVSRAAALISIGSANRRFWESYGARESQLFEARYAVENDHFSDLSDTDRARAGELKGKLHLNATVVFLFVGRLIKRKNVDLIIEAIKRIANPDLALLIVGDGDERAALEAIAAGEQRVIFAGGAPHNDLKRYYSLGDVLVLPARDEPWGLVVNEAMAAGLAVIAHEHCGAAVDLVGPDNGVALRTFEVEELVGAVTHLANDNALLRRMQACSKEKIRGWSIEAAARGIIKAVTQTGGSVNQATAVGEVE
ncbi:MAG: glycosyltransferase family 4 protein [Acidobacteriota bacterium]